MLIVSTTNIPKQVSRTPKRQPSKSWNLFLFSHFLNTTTNRNIWRKWNHALRQLIDRDRATERSKIDVVNCEQLLHDTSYEYNQLFLELCWSNFILAVDPCTYVNVLYAFLTESNFCYEKSVQVFCVPYSSVHIIIINHASVVLLHELLIFGRDALSSRIRKTFFLQFCMDSWIKFVIASTTLPKPELWMLS